MEQHKTLVPKLNLKNPVDVYRMGWLVLAGTSVVYMFFIMVRAGLGLDYSTPQQARYTQTAPNMQASARGHGYSRTTDNGYSIVSSRPVPQGYGQNGHQATQKVAMRQESSHPQNRFRATRTPQEKINAIREQVSSANSRHPAANKTAREPIKRIPVPKRRITQKRIQPQAEAKPAKHTTQDMPSQNPALNYMNQASYMHKFTYDLENPGFTKPVIKVVKAREIKSDIFGVTLARGKSVKALRKEWRKLKAQYKKPLRNLEPLIIKENNGDGYPVQLVVGPFSDSPSAVRFCSSIYRRFNCNLKRYNGSPL